MFLRTVDILEQHTADYWILSNQILGRTKAKITVETAINRTNNLEFNLGPHRALLKFVRSLSDVVVQGKRNKRKTPATITILSIQAVGGVQ